MCNTVQVSLTHLGTHLIYKLVITAQKYTALVALIDVQIEYLDSAALLRWNCQRIYLFGQIRNRKNGDISKLDVSEYSLLYNIDGHWAHGHVTSLSVND